MRWIDPFTPHWEWYEWIEFGLRRACVWIDCTFFDRHWYYYGWTHSEGNWRDDTYRKYYEWKCFWCGKKKPEERQ